MIKALEKMSNNELIAYISKLESQKTIATQSAIGWETKARNMMAINTENAVTISELTTRVIVAEELVRYYEMLRYTKQRNKLYDNEDAPTLFSVMGVDEPEMVNILEDGCIQSVKEHTRISHPKKRAIDYSHLPKEVIPHDALNGEEICELCGKKMKLYKHIDHVEIVFIPAQVKALVHQVPCFECENCCDQDGQARYVNSRTWIPLFSKSKCSSSMLAAIIDYKFDKGLPYHTIERMFKENDIIIPRQNMSNWIIASMEYINALYELMQKDLRKKAVIMADETTCQVLREEGKRASSTSYMWIYRTCEWDAPIILYDYQATRRRECPQAFLEGFNGYLVTDAYAGYNAVGAVRATCHVHAMRYIREAYELLPTKDHLSLEYKAYTKYQEIFKIDHALYVEARKLYAEDINKQLEYVQAHRDKTLVKFQEFLLWLTEIKPQVFYKAKFKQAINYLLNSQTSFQTFIQDARIPLGNNLSEQMVKPFVLVRQRCKFFVSTRGADAAAKIYSLMLTAKENGYGTYAYFVYLFDEIRKVDLKDEEALRRFLPYEGQIPEYCKMKTVNEIKKKIKELEDSK